MKLKVLKGPLRAWSKEKFDHLDNKISERETVIHDLDNLGDKRTLNVMAKARLNATQHALQSWTIRR